MNKQIVTLNHSATWNWQWIAACKAMLMIELQSYCKLGLKCFQQCRTPVSSAFKTWFRPIASATHLNYWMALLTNLALVNRCDQGSNKSFITDHCISINIKSIDAIVGVEIDQKKKKICFTYIILVNARHHINREASLKRHVNYQTSSITHNLWSSAGTWHVVCCCIIASFLELRAFAMQMPHERQLIRPDAAKRPSAVEARHKRLE